MEDLSNIEQTLILREDDGTISLRIGLIFTAYFRRAYTPEVRTAVLTATKLWIDTVAGHLTWAQRSNERWLRYRDETVPELARWLAGHPTDEAWSFALHGGVKSLDASAFFLRAMGDADWKPKHILSHLSLGLPLTWFADHPGSFPSFCQELCSVLRPLSGYAGIGIAPANGSMLATSVEPAVYEIAQRFPGIEVDIPEAHSLFIGDCIKGVNWLTVLGDPLVERFGGADKLPTALPPHSSVLPFKGGVIVQSGPHPQLGDRHAGRMPQDYVAVNRALKALRAPSTGPFHHGNPGRRFDADASLAWLARFD